jgi:hypothetical protein
MTKPRSELLSILTELSERFPEFRFGQMIAGLAWAGRDFSNEAIFEIEDDAQDDVVSLLEPNRNGESWKPMDVVHRAVERIDNPAIFGPPRRNWRQTLDLTFCGLLLTQEVVIWKGFTNRLLNDILGRQIGFGHQVFGSFFPWFKAVLPVEQHPSTALGGIDANRKKVGHIREV